MAKSKQGGIGIYVGQNEQAIAEARLAINEILGASVDNSTKVKALEVLGSLCSINHNSISGCQINGPL